MKSIAIMQPTFLPWIGYFSLIDCVDEFVFLDNVPFDKRSWQQRNRIKTAQGPIWLSVPVLSKGRTNQLIHDVNILKDADKSPFHKIKTAIEHNYKRAPYYHHYAKDFFALFDDNKHNLALLNQSIIQWACRQLGIKTSLINASTLPAIGQKEKLLVNICKDRCASHYISPPGSKTYLDNSDAFQAAGIVLDYHNYEHPPYAQLYGNFEPYMCIIDLLFNEGPASADIIKKGLTK